MSPESRTELIRAIHDARSMVVLAISGGGFSAVTDLLLGEGAMRTLLDVYVPCSIAALESFTERPITGAVSEDTARAMASACLTRAYELRPYADTNIAGVACIGAQVANRLRGGTPRACLAIASDDAVRSWAITLPEVTSEEEIRKENQDRMIADELLVAVAQATGAYVG